MSCPAGGFDEQIDAFADGLPQDRASVTKAAPARCSASGAGVAALAPSCGSRGPFADGDRGGLRVVVDADVLSLPRSTTGSLRRNWAGLRWAGQFDRLPARGERHRAQDDLVIESAPRLGRYALHAQAVRKNLAVAGSGGTPQPGVGVRLGLSGRKGVHVLPVGALPLFLVVAGVAASQIHPTRAHQSSTWRRITCFRAPESRARG